MREPRTRHSTSFRRMITGRNDTTNGDGRLVPRNLRLLRPHYNTCWARLSSVSEKPFYLLQETHAEPGRGTINHQFGMFAAKGLGNVAVPADRPVGAQQFLEFFGGN